MNICQPQRQHVKTRFAIGSFAQSVHIAEVSSSGEKMSDDPLHLLRHRLYYRVGAAVSGLRVNTMPFYISPRRALLDDLGFDN